MRAQSLGQHCGSVTGSRRQKVAAERIPPDTCVRCEQRCSTVTKVFISYAREAQEQVRELADDIAALGWAVWFDEQLSGGTAWWDRILESIRGCDVFLFALSRESVDS